MFSYSAEPNFLEFAPAPKFSMSEAEIGSESE